MPQITQLVVGHQDLDPGSVNTEPVQLPTLKSSSDRAGVEAGGTLTQAGSPETWRLGGECSQMFTHSFQPPPQCRGVKPQAPCGMPLLGPAGGQGGGLARWGWAAGRRSLSDLPLEPTVLGVAKGVDKRAEQDQHGHQPLPCHL